ncbi:hypothetical protein GF389_00265 [Candidatus Dojkabacteria bacterium]|nr:hypothetical protein [Candidatus Dojkabacteria bacterium]
MALSELLSLPEHLDSGSLTQIESNLLRRLQAYDASEDIQILASGKEVLEKQKNELRTIICEGSSPVISSEELDFILRGDPDKNVNTQNSRDPKQLAEWRDRVVASDYNTGFNRKVDAMYFRLCKGHIEHIEDETPTWKLIKRVFMGLDGLLSKNSIHASNVSAFTEMHDQGTNIEWSVIPLSRGNAYTGAIQVGGEDLTINVANGAVTIYDNTHGLILDRSALKIYDLLYSTVEESINFLDSK